MIRIGINISQVFCNSKIPDEGVISTYVLVVITCTVDLKKNVTFRIRTAIVVRFVIKPYY